MKKLLLFIASVAVMQGAANMILTNILVNANGQIVGTLSPATCPLSPSTGVTGITLLNTGNPNAATVVSATTSGCILTITTYGVASSNFPAFTDDLVSNIVISISAASNLQDSAGNTMSVTGNTNLHPSVNNSTIVPLMGTYASTHLMVDANPTIDSRGSTAKAALWMTVDGCVRFVSDANVTGINAFGLNFSNILTTWQDGSTLLSTTSQTSGVDWSLYTVASGLSGIHTYEICENATANNGNSGTLILSAIQLVGGTFGPQPAYRPWVLWFGASEINCNNGGGYNSTQCPAWLAMRKVGYADQSLGVAGWPVTNNTACVGTGCIIMNYTPNSLVNCAGRISACTGTSFPKGNDPAFAEFVEPGGNDALDTTLIGSNYTTVGTFKGDAVTLLSNLVTTYGNTSHKIYVFDQYCSPGVGPTCTSPNSNTAAAYMTAWDGAVAAYNSLATGTTAISSPTFKQGCTNPANGPPDFLSGGFHLTAIGNSNWVNCMVPVIAGISSTSYISSGSLSGNVNVASSPVTLTLNGINANGTVAFFSTANSGTTPQTITLTSSNASDTFAITGGTGGSTCASPCTTTPTNANSSFSFTVKSSTGGLRTISFSNAQGLGWIDPMSLTYNPIGFSGSISLFVPFQ